MQQEFLNFNGCLMLAVENHSFHGCYRNSIVWKKCGRGAALESFISQMVKLEFREYTSDKTSW